MISTLGKKLPEQAVQIFICTFLPSTIWIGKIHVTMQPFRALAPVCKFYSPVTGNAFDQLRGKGGQRRNDGVLHGRGFSVSHLDCYVKSGLAFCQGGKASLALALAAHHRICFPMSGFQTAVYRLVPLSNRLSLVVFATRFPAPVAFSFAAQHLLRSLFTRYFP